jgi:hypothetical protein
LSVDRGGVQHSPGTDVQSETISGHQICEDLRSIRIDALSNRTHRFKPDLSGSILYTQSDPDVHPDADEDSDSHADPFEYPDEHGDSDQYSYSDTD